jgi:hypothetical protein
VVTSSIPRPVAISNPGTNNTQRVHRDMDTSNRMELQAWVMLAHSREQEWA